MVSEDDTAAAIESTTNYVARERQKRPRVELLRGPNTHISRTVGACDDLAAAVRHVSA